MRRLPAQLRAAFATLIVVGLAIGPAAGAARAADVATTVTLVTVTDPAYRGLVGSYTAQVDPAGAQGTVVFESSPDDITWTYVADGPVQSDGSASASVIPDSSTPLGPRTIRARFEGSAGWAPSTSDNTISQTVDRQASSFTTFQAWTTIPDVLQLVPDSPIRLSVSTIGTGDAITFEEWNGSSWDVLPGTVGTVVLGQYYQDVGVLGEGSHTLRARFDGSPYFAPSESTIVVDLEKGATVVNSTVPSPVQANHAFLVSAAVGGGATGIPVTGHVTVTDTTTSLVLGSGSGGGFSGDVGPLSLGTHVLVIDFAGDADYQPSTSGPIPMYVVADTVDATGVRLTSGTVYPVRDGYRDTVKAIGDRLEPASVAIKVLNSTGHIVRRGSVAGGSGPYAWSWNGKNSSSKLVPPGHYRIVQTLRDAYGTTRTITSKVTLSLKRLHYLTKTYTKYGAAISALGHAGVGSVRATGSRFFHGVVLRSGFASTDGGTGWSSVGYGWTLPSAVTYRSISVKAFGLTAKRGAIAQLGVWNWSICPSSAGTWFLDCFGRWKDILYSTAWYTRSASVTSNRRGRTVRTAVYLPAGELGKADIGKVALTVTYAVLR